MTARSVRGCDTRFFGSAYDFEGLHQRNLGWLVGAREAAFDLTWQHRGSPKFAVDPMIGVTKMLGTQPHAVSRSRKYCHLFVPDKVTASANLP